MHQTSQNPGSNGQCVPCCVLFDLLLQRKNDLELELPVLHQAGAAARLTDDLLDAEYESGMSELVEKRQERDILIQAQVRGLVSWALKYSALSIQLSPSSNIEAFSMKRCSASPKRNTPYCLQCTSFPQDNNKPRVVVMVCVLFPEAFYACTSRKKYP